MSRSLFVERAEGAGCAGIGRILFEEARIELDGLFGIVQLVASDDRGLVKELVVLPLVRTDVDPAQEKGKRLLEVAVRFAKRRELGQSPKVRLVLGEQLPQDRFCELTVAERIGEFARAPVQRHSLLVVELELRAPAERLDQITLPPGATLELLDLNEHFVALGIEFQRLFQRLFRGLRVARPIPVPNGEPYAQIARHVGTRFGFLSMASRSAEAAPAQLPVMGAKRSISSSNPESDGSSIRP